MPRDGIPEFALTLKDGSEGRWANEGCENLVCSIDRMMMLSATAWRRGDLSGGLELARRGALSLQPACTGSDCRQMAGVWYAFLLTFARRLTMATDVLDLVLADAAGEPTRKVRAAVGMCRAEIHFAHDRMDLAAEHAEAALALLEGAELDELSPLGYALLARRALRCADTGLALQYADRLMTGALLNHVRHMPARGAWVTAEIRDVRDGQENAAPIVRGLITDKRLAIELLAAQPESAAWMVRAARNLGDEDLAALAAERSTVLAARNPSLPAVHAGAVHAAALLARDHQRLVAVADLHQDRWNRASALEDAGTVLAEHQVESGRSVELLGRAADHYLAIGASRDGSRVARKLRDLGVRRGRLRRPNGQEGGAGQLTETEFVVAELVSQGLTNARVGQEMFISTHTVAAHLKKIFRKLNIASRVELASQWGRFKDLGSGKGPKETPGTGDRPDSGGRVVRPLGSAVVNLHLA